MAEELSQRAKLILASVVAHFIATAEPVGSRTVAKESRVAVSPATVRNVMSDLEELGYLHQPHVSAGRVPTLSGIRFYVDSILQVRELDEKVKSQLKRVMARDRVRDLTEMLKSAGRALSSVTRQMAVVASPNPEQEVFRHMEFVLLGPGKILVVLVSGTGQVQNRIVEAEEELNQEDLDKFGRYLNDLLADLTLSEVKKRVASEMTLDKNRFDAVLNRALALGHQALKDEVTGDIFVEGRTNLIGQPEFSNVASLRSIFRAFEEKSTLLRLLDRSMSASGVQIFIGAESDLAGLEGVTAVTSSYGEDERPLGALAVIGPTRMDYSQVIPLVDYTARLIGRILESRGR